MGHEHSIRRAPPRTAAPARGPATAPPSRAVSFSPAGLQRRLGNQVAGALLAQLGQGRAVAARRAPSDGGCCAGRRLQAKLTVGPAGDRFEQEADRMADRVMRMDGAKVAAGDHVSARPAGAAVQRLCSKCEDDLSSEPGQHREGPAVGPELVRLQVDGVLSERPLDSQTADSIQAMRGGGQPLPAAERAFFEPRFGRDFGGVRIHADGSAARAASAIGARAFTIGSDVAFAAGQYRPGNPDGRRLLAHELTHVVQQGAAPTSTVLKSGPAEGTLAAPEADIVRRQADGGPVPRELNEAEMAAAVAFNERFFADARESEALIERIRDALGISAFPAVIDEDFVRAVVRWQADHGLTQDGKLGPATARSLFQGIGAAGAGRCEVIGVSYDVGGPIDIPNAANPRTTTFRLLANFRSDVANGIFPSCCEVRQDVEWDATLAASLAALGIATPLHRGFPPGVRAGAWIEDRDEADTRYGHRTGPHSAPQSGDEYLDAAGRRNQAYGHRYRGRDTPGIQGPAPTLRGRLRFHLRVIDVCNGSAQADSSRILVVNWL